MPDHVDFVQAHVLAEQEAMERRCRLTAAGLTHCEECDEPISAVRQGLGARRCMTCQRAAEAARKWPPRVAR